jgi:crotonobetainyl-CoA:carnitine CoA-transferase CaiB-like acyl-CoA transferase
MIRGCPLILRQIAPDIANKVLGILHDVAPDRHPRQPLASGGIDFALRRGIQGVYTGETTMSTNAPLGVLDGYKVLDFTQYVAGPTVTLMMAEMGAEVIKVELAPGGDKTRLAPMQVEGRSGYYVQHNRGKKSLCLDPKTPDGLAILKAMVAKVDVVVENFAPGVIGRMGLGWETVKSINPRAIMCSVSAFGQTGPLSSQPGFDTLGAAYAGITSMGGEPDGPPYVVMAAIGDVSTGAHAMGAIACALLYRERSGRGQYLDLSLLDTYFHYHEASVQIHSLSKGAYKPMRSGLHNFYLAPVGVFKARSGYIIIMCPMDHIFGFLCNAMGRPELAQDPRFIDNESRVKNCGALVDEIERWIGSLPSDAAALAAMREHRVPCAPVLSVEEAINHPHLRERGTIRKVRDRILGEFELPGFALRFSDFPAPLDLEAPFLGEHNAEVLGDYLGYPAEQVADLERRGVLRHERH